MNGLIFSILFFLISFCTYGQNKTLVDFEKIRELLEQDQLQESLDKSRKFRRVKKQKRRLQIIKYNTPSSRDFWPFFNQYWLVKRIEKLNWDARFPTLGLGDYTGRFLRKMGVRSKYFKILMIDNKEITHMALPSNGEHNLFLLSFPFVKALGLSKLEIALLIYEDYIRCKKGYFKNFVQIKELDTFLGNNYYKKKINFKILDTLSKKYDQFIFHKGFNFKQQYKVTTEMKENLSKKEGLLQAYKKMIKKIDSLVKVDKNYKSYNKFYPSPELQLGWLSNE